MKISAVLALLASTLQVQGAEVQDINVPIDSILDQKLAIKREDGEMTEMQDKLFTIEQ